jgi:F0F1-type ATP synthase assembly protein I
LDQNPNSPPNSALSYRLGGDTDTGPQAGELAKAMGYLGLTFMIALVANAIALTVLKGTNLVYLVVPFNIVFVAAIVWLTWLVYGGVMAIVTAFSVILPPFTILMLLLAYNKASKILKSKGFRATIAGELQKIR